MFNHEKLNVYQEALEFAKDADRMVEKWSRKHAFIDHLVRASESVVINLVEGCRLKTIKSRTRAIDFSLGSLLECAACLDIAMVKSLPSGESVLDKKTQLVCIFGKLIGLRKSWMESCLHEEQEEYGKDFNLFHHEKLEVYQLTLNLIRQLHLDGMIETFPNRIFRQIDDTSTSILLNIAEGNGRYAVLDQHKFLLIANRSSIKLAALLDLCHKKDLLGEKKVLEIKLMLKSICNMSYALANRKY